MSRLLVMLCLHASIAHAYQVKHTASGAAVHWNEARVEVSLGPAIRARYGDDAVRAAFMAADAWRGLGGPDIQIVAGRRTNTIELLDPWPYEARELAVTVSACENGSGAIREASIYVNPAFDFALLNEGDDERDARFDLGSVLTHEMGHFQGLAHTEADHDATMWARIGRGETHQRSVEADDELGLEEAYAGVSAMRTTGAGCGRASVAPTKTASASVVAALAFVTIVIGRRRLRISTRH